MRSPVQVRFAIFCIAAAAVAGCTQIFESNNDGGLFSKPADVFVKTEWGRPASPVTIEIGSSGPVGPEDFVNADGTCAPKAVEAAVAASPAAATPPANTPGANTQAAIPAGGTSDGSVPAVSASASGSGIETTSIPGGIALGMSECDAVRGAGKPSNVVISTGEQGERKVVLTYAGGSWPGIYTFNAGRLKVVDAMPDPERRVAKKKKTPPRSRSAAQQAPSQAFVQ